MFYKRIADPGSDEYTLLQEIRADYPDYKIHLHRIKQNEAKERYKGLTYDYMREYIRSHVPEAEIEISLHTLEEMILISHCHSQAHRYPVIKKWFLEQFPEVKVDLKESGSQPVEEKPKSDAA